MALYFPSAKELGQVSLALPRPADLYRVHWINIDRGKRIESQMSAKDLQLVSPPSQENWVAAIVRLKSSAVSSTSEQLFAKQNLVAWCIVPFDAKQRGPAERAAMLRRLGLQRVAYDWREKHVATFEDEILQYQKNGLEFFAFWDWHPSLGPLIDKYKVRPQIWKTAPSPQAASQQERIQAAAKTLLPLVDRTRQLGLKFGLYNHGGWGGKPENLVALCEYLRKIHQADHVGIVYNLHHAHDDMQEFSKNLCRMEPYLLCLNLNGMVSAAELDADAKKKILPIGTGSNDRQILRAIIASGYDGPIGVLDHRNEIDAEESLRLNLDGLGEISRSLEVD